MGLDLKLLPVNSTTPGCDFSHDLLCLHADSELFEFLQGLSNAKGIEVRRGGLATYTSTSEDGESCYGDTETDKYGDRLKSVLASDIMETLKGYKSDSWKNRAIIAFIGELPPNLEIYLYWH